MPTVLRWGPYRAFFYSNEGNEPPHVHVRAGGGEAKFWLSDVSLAIDHGFGDREIRSILVVLKDHRDDLLRAWDEHFGG